ncbi:MAG: transposase [Coprobacillus cateniformis]
MVDKAIEKEMKGLYPNGYQSLMSITGIGPVFAAGILSEIGDISYFKSDASLAKYAGFHWKKRMTRAILLLMKNIQRIHVINI